ncbi:MAG: hypothetical protein DI586_08350 [Micavibrio aeruginosavorus]|uniref:Apea-like HEPN domain-containing protein n=1 Tax=Micavibrio aeruginosavorus TaxID=349221 RepID=A0A2W5FI55_9BACT|nr:MAG: hypothetical protein DI586_08350 [Micavibrio aeruginosavorus]
MPDLQQIACNYFLLLSSLEYALKNSGFVKVDSSYNAEPDWNKFKDEVHDKMNIDISDPDIQEIIKSRPARQIFKNDNLTWATPDRINPQKTKEFIDACLTIRNNLFHGGKHKDGNAGRNEVLIKAATKILNAAIEACPLVKNKFDEATL